MTEWKRQAMEEFLDLIRLAGPISIAMDELVRFLPLNGRVELCIYYFRTDLTILNLQPKLKYDNYIRPKELNIKDYNDIDAKTKEEFFERVLAYFKEKDFRIFIDTLRISLV